MSKMPTKVANFDDMESYAQAGLDMEKYLEFKKVLEHAIKEDEKQDEPVDNDDVIGVAWFNARKTVCVIIRFDPHLDWFHHNNGTPILGGPAAYISPVYGEDQDKDMQETKDWGASFPLDIAVQIIDRCGGWLKPSKLEFRPREKTNSPLKFKLKYKGAVDTDDVKLPSCKCGNPSLEPHTCPYLTEISDDFSTLCTCCENCQHECAMDV